MDILHMVYTFWTHQHEQFDGQLQRLCEGRVLMDGFTPAVMTAV